MRWIRRAGQSWAPAAPASASAAAARSALAFFDEHLFALLAARRQLHDQPPDEGADHEAGADPLGEEYRWVAARKQHRASQVLLHQRPEDEAEDHRRRLAFELRADVAHHAEH